MPSSRRTTSYLALLSLPTAILAQTTDTLTSTKRGLCYVDTKTSSTDDKIWDASGTDLTWYYNYGASPTSDFSSSDLTFVPMLWGAPSSDTDMTFYDTVTGLLNSSVKVPYVLAFNEPDGCSDGGSCVTAAVAAQTWIREIEPLKELGVKLGAPAVTSAPTGFDWLVNFFTECAGNCSADFIPVHYYGNFEGLASHIGQVNATYPNMSMWVTEYAYADVSLEDNQSFYNQSVSFFAGLSYLTHYSYFGAFRSDVSNVGPNAAMLTQKGELTDIGAWYLGEQETGNIPKGAAAGGARGFVGWVGVVLVVGWWCWV